MVIKCDCKHDFQDKTYGVNNRVHNYAPAANNKTGGWRCTVCKAIKPKQVSVNEKAANPCVQLTGGYGGSFWTGY